LPVGRRFISFSALSAAAGSRRMNAILGLMVPMLLGADIGWERRPDGTIAYIVQIDPDSADEMKKSGISINSAVPQSLRNRMSDIDIRIGRDKLPNQNTLPPDLPTETPAAAAKPPDRVPTPTPTYMTNGYQPG